MHFAFWTRRWNRPMVSIRRVPEDLPWIDGCLTSNGPMEYMHVENCNVNSRFYGRTKTSRELCPRINIWFPLLEIISIKSELRERNRSLKSSFPRNSGPPCVYLPRDSRQKKSTVPPADKSSKKKFCFNNAKRARISLSRTDLIRRSFSRRYRSSCFPPRESRPGENPFARKIYEKSTSPTRPKLLIRGENQFSGSGSCPTFS